MFSKRGIVLNPQDLHPAWPQRLQAAKINALGIHPAGGPDARHSLEWALYHRLLPETKRLFHQLNCMGITVEYEAHAMSWLLPRALFQTHPHWFRMNREGARTPDANFCPSQADALFFVEKRAEELARQLDTGSDRYFFWLDDQKDAACHCPACRGLSAGDQQMLIVNAMLRGIRKYNRQASLSYLAYLDAMAGPEKIMPLPGVTLEYAPFLRDLHRPLLDPACEKNAAEARSLQRLLKLFGSKGAQALEYWMDCSLYSDWQKPPKKLTLDEAIMQPDCQAYKALGFEAVTSFGCFLGADYDALYGEPPVLRYGELLAAEE